MNSRRFFKKKDHAVKGREEDRERKRRRDTEGYSRRKE